MTPEQELYMRLYDEYHERGVSAGSADLIRERMIAMTRRFNGADMRAIEQCWKAKGVAAWVAKHGWIHSPG